MTTARAAAERAPGGAAASVLSPLSGTVVALADVPDPVFAEEVAGPGVAIDPDTDGAVHVVAPVDGRVGSLFPHAFALETPSGRTVLVHLGVDTARLGGLGSVLRVAVGDDVRAGDVVMTWEPGRVAAGGLATVSPVVALQADAGAVELLVPVGSRVQAGDPLLSWV